MDYTNSPFYANPPNSSFLPAYSAPTESEVLVPKKRADPDAYMTSREAADFLGLRSLDSLYKLIEEKRLICQRPRHHRRLLRSSVEAYRKSITE